MNIKRKLTNKIKYSLKNIAVTAIIGARQVGKTTLSKHIYSLQIGTRKIGFNDLEIIG
ncbi:MAG: hypothetical protein L3J20_05885 [Flavobacteriaceae bacterium]|nr:hypothetical protein [Flavobacteriaceae bacterium]